MRQTFLLLALITCLSVHAECVLPGVQPVQNPTLKYRAFGSRCEGLYESKVASVGTVELVSLTRGAFPDNLQVPQTLLITTSASQAVTIRAVPLRSAVYYRMEAPLSPRQVLRWPTGDILARTNITGRYIGVLGELSTGDQKLYVPASINGAAGPLTAVFRAGRPLRNVRLRTKVVRNGRCAEPAPWQPATASADSDNGRIIRIVLPQQQGPFCIEAVGTDGDQPVSATYQVSP
jgi:hypothetical protein